VANSLPNATSGDPSTKYWPLRAGGALHLTLAPVCCPRADPGILYRRDYRHPQHCGSFTFTVQVADSSTPALTAQQQFTLTPFTGPERGPVALVTANFRNATLPNTSVAAADLASLTRPPATSPSSGRRGREWRCNLYRSNRLTAKGRNVPGCHCHGGLERRRCAGPCRREPGRQHCYGLLGSTKLDGTFTVATGSPLLPPRLPPES